MRLSHVLTSTAALTIASVPSGAHAGQVSVVFEDCGDGTSLAVSVPDDVVAGKSTIKRSVFGRGVPTLSATDAATTSNTLLVRAGGREFTAIVLPDGRLIVPTLAEVDPTASCDSDVDVDPGTEVLGEVLTNPNPEGEPTPAPAPAPAPTPDAPQPAPTPDATAAPEPTPAPQAPQPTPAPAPPVVTPDPAPAAPAAPEAPAAPAAPAEDDEPPVVGIEPDDEIAPEDQPQPLDGPDPDPDAEPETDAEQPTSPASGPQAADRDRIVVRGDGPQRDDLVEGVAIDVLRPEDPTESETGDVEVDDFDAYIHGLLAWVPSSEDEPEDSSAEDASDEFDDLEVVIDLRDGSDEPAPLLLTVGADSEGAAGQVDELASPLFLTVDDSEDEVEVAMPRFLEVDFEDGVIDLVDAATPTTDAPVAPKPAKPMLDLTRFLAKPAPQPADEVEPVLPPAPGRPAPRGGTGPASRAMFGLVTLAGTSGAIVGGNEPWTFA